MSPFTLFTIAALSLGATAPALAQDAMTSHDKMASHDQMSSGAMKMSAADKRKMKSCNTMSHEAAMRDSRCASLMQAHPDMMKHDSMSAGH